MKRILILFLLVIVCSCSTNPESYLEHVNGYWEIDQVLFTDGAKKQYKDNETIDYISINDSLKGFRKKLKPGFNSKYITSKDAEGITVKIENDSLNFYYKTPYASWKETVLSANENQMKVVNDRETVYIYKRYKPLELDLE
ncbi:lipocalin-like protein [Winogradskyella wandonensis]|uniref:Lipocalin-like protein n=1 Tax=Winogradskyella wandonensis TaxID=1442586 RepID=A0A4R1KNT4_9FLAO|nr:lipocalin family protein [Winogradskyella wandonensis]TCK66714.1 lipocalin-like protein [Winogradskyella wandonensis]